MPTDIEIATMISNLREDHKALLKLAGMKEGNTTVGSAANMLEIILFERHKGGSLAATSKRGR